MMYSLVKPFLHTLEPEYAHTLAIRVLKHEVLPAKKWTSEPMLSVDCFGKKFPNPIGMAAGFDKNADVFSALAKHGFGFAEVGTITLEPQAGNEKPRLFRLSEDAAIINRLGFNNEGVAYALQNIEKKSRGNAILGINIGKNKHSDNAVFDYTELLKRVYAVADYVTINVSSPNTQGLRDLQQKRLLNELLEAVLKVRDDKMQAGATRLPIVLKISPDIDQVTKEDIAEIALQLKLDGLIVSNTTIKRPNTLKNLKRSEQGGLSGKPLMEASTKLLGDMYQLTSGKIMLIGVGGIASAEDAYQKILHGATLVQLYTALVYQGFGLVKQIHDGLVAQLKRDGYAHVSEAVGKTFV
jgi:dihydroorotate dehydrogenase